MSSSNNHHESSMKGRLRGLIGRDASSTRVTISAPTNPVAYTAGQPALVIRRPMNPITLPAALVPSTSSTMPNIHASLNQPYLLRPQPPHMRPLGGELLQRSTPPPRTSSRKAQSSQDSGTSDFLDEEWERERWEKERVKSYGKDHRKLNGIWNPFGEGKNLGERLTLEEFMEKEKKRQKAERDKALGLSVPQPTCTIITGPATAPSTFLIHKHIITTASPYFRAAFEGGFKECSTQTIRMEEVETATFGLLAQYVYTGKLTLPPPTSSVLLAKLWLLADHCLMSDLQNKTMDMLFDVIMHTTVMEELSVVDWQVEALMEFLWETKAAEEAGDRAIVLKNLLVLFWARRVTTNILKKNILGMPVELQIEIVGMMRVFQGSFNRTMVDHFRVAPEREKKNGLRVG